jgi:hypothetical protein
MILIMQVRQSGPITTFGPILVLEWSSGGPISERCIKYLFCFLKS